MYNEIRSWERARPGGIAKPYEDINNAGFCCQPCNTFFLHQCYLQSPAVDGTVKHVCLVICRAVLQDISVVNLRPGNMTRRQGRVACGQYSSRDRHAAVVRSGIYPVRTVTHHQSRTLRHAAHSDVSKPIQLLGRCAVAQMKVSDRADCAAMAPQLRSKEALALLVPLAWGSGRAQLLERVCVSLPAATPEGRPWSCP